MIYSENILVCIAVPLLISLLFLYSRKGTRRIILSFVIGMVCCLLSAYISGYAQFASGLDEQKMSTFYTPIIEELMKIMPLLFYLFVFSPKSYSLFTASIGLGLGFATFENCCYILSFGASSLSFVLIRAMAVGVMHLVCSLILVFGLTNARKFKVLSVPTVVGSAALSMIFHGLYNLLVSKSAPYSIIGFALPIVTALILFFPFRAVVRDDTGESSS